MPLPTGAPAPSRFRRRPRGTDDVEIIFADDGAGMTPDVQRQAFDPFFTTRRNEGGTGLGLHIVYNLVTQQLGGRMMLEFKTGTRHDVSHYHARGPPKGGADGRRLSKPTEPRNGRTGRCPPPDRRYRNRSGDSTARKWKIAVIDDDHGRA